MTQTMNTLQQVVELNSYGVCCLASAETPPTQNEALASFKSALTILSSACATTLASRGTMAQPILNITIEASPSFLSVTGERRAFYMTCREETDSFEAFTAQSVVVLFNMALGLHHRGSVLKHESSLRKASCLYEHCLQLLTSVEHCFDGAEVVAMNALKNLAEVYSRIGNFEGIRCVLDSLTLMEIRIILRQQENDSLGPPEKIAAVA
jgi:hypothetical protein